MKDYALLSRLKVFISPFNRQVLASLNLYWLIQIQTQITQLLMVRWSFLYLLCWLFYLLILHLYYNYTIFTLFSLSVWFPSFICTLSGDSFVASASSPSSFGQAIASGPLVTRARPVISLFEVLLFCYYHINNLERATLTVQESVCLLVGQSVC